MNIILTILVVVMAMLVMLAVARPRVRKELRRLGRELGWMGRGYGVRPGLREVVLATGAAVLTIVVIGLWAPGLGFLAAVPLLGSLSIYTDLPTYSFQEAVSDALTGKEGYPVELVQGTLTVQAFNAGIYIGDLFERLEGSHAWAVNLRGAIKKAVSSGAINSPAYVKMTANGLAAAVQNDKCCGIAIYPYVCAQGDVVSYIKTDCVMP